jgi:hypothetical protein
MARLCKLVLLLSLLLGVPSAASAWPLVIDITAYPLGTDLSHVFDGVTLSILSNRPNADGPDGDQAFQPVASPVVLEAPREYAVWTDWLNLYYFRHGNFRVLEITLDRPTDFVAIDSVWYSDAPGMLAFDSAGNLLNADSWSSIPATYTHGPGGGYSVNRLQREQRDISRVVFGGLMGTSRPTRIEVHRVPTPTTLMLTAMGALLLVRRRNRA